MGEANTVGRGELEMCVWRGNVRGDEGGKRNEEGWSGRGGGWGREEVGKVPTPII